MRTSNKNRFEIFERELVKWEKPDFYENLRIYEALYKEAVELSVLPLKNPLEDIEIDFKVARIVNHVHKITQNNG